jgi:hypothetical protein
LKTVSAVGLLYYIICFIIRFSDIKGIPIDISWTGKQKTNPKLKHATGFFWDALSDKERLRQKHVSRYTEKQEAGRQTETGTISEHKMNREIRYTMGHRFIGR